MTPGQRVAADEQRERLVLVWRPRHQLMEEEARPQSTVIAPTPSQNRFAPSQRAQPIRRVVAALETPVGRCGSAPSSLVDWPAMPIYEYRCPNGHTFEMFQRMADPPVRDVRDVWRGAGGEDPVPGCCALQGLRLLLDRLRSGLPQGGQGRWRRGWLGRQEGRRERRAVEIDHERVRREVRPSPRPRRRARATERSPRRPDPAARGVGEPLGGVAAAPRGP